MKSGLRANRKATALIIGPRERTGYDTSIHRPHGHACLNLRLSRIVISLHSKPRDLLRLLNIDPLRTFIYETARNTA